MMEDDVMEIEQLIATLAPLMSMEREAENCQSSEEYRAFRRRVEVVNQDALDGLRQFIDDRPDWGHTDMQSVYYFLTKHPDLIYSRTDQGVLTALINEAWRGKRGWKA
jgi:hypothetical protein